MRLCHFKRNVLIVFILYCTLTICISGLSHIEGRQWNGKCDKSKITQWATMWSYLAKWYSRAKEAKLKRSIYRLALLKIEHLIYFKGCSHSLSNRHTPLTCRAYLHWLFWPPASTLRSRVWLFFYPASFCVPCSLLSYLAHLLCIPPIILPPLPLLCASACKVGIGKIPKHLRNPVAFCLSVCLCLSQKMTRFGARFYLRDKKLKPSPEI